MTIVIFTQHEVVHEELFSPVFYDILNTSRQQGPPLAPPCWPLLLKGELFGLPHSPGM